MVSIRPLAWPAGEPRAIAEIWPACSKRQGTTLNKTGSRHQTDLRAQERLHRSYDVAAGHASHLSRPGGVHGGPSTRPGARGGGAGRSPARDEVPSHARAAFSRGTGAPRGTLTDLFGTFCSEIVSLALLRARAVDLACTCVDLDFRPDRPNGAVRTACRSEHAPHRPPRPSTFCRRGQNSRRGCPQVPDRTRPALGGGQRRARPRTAPNATQKAGRPTHCQRSFPTSLPSA
jgi:hypothetical protein